MSLQSIVVTGANRGLGLELVRQLLALSPTPKYVIATTRKASNEELDKLKKNNPSLHILKFDANDYTKYEEFVAQVGKIVGDYGVDTLINNAGIALHQTLTEATPDQMLNNFDVNVVSPLILTKAILPLLKVCLIFVNIIYFYLYLFRILYKLE